jgi:hypothetical protein
MNLDDLLTECAKVLLFSFARNRGEKKEYRGDLQCSGEPPGPQRSEPQESQPREAARPKPHHH